MPKDQSIPEPARGIYPGWRIVAALFLVTTALFGVALYSFIVFSRPLAAEFHWSAAQTGSLVSAMWLAAPFALIAPWLVNRLEPWRLVIAALLLQAAVLCVLQFINQFWQLYALRIVMGLGKVTIMTAVPVIIALWFNRRFATAIAIVWAGSSAGGLILSPVTEMLNDRLGWRPATVALAGGVVAVVLVILMLRGRLVSPQNLGLALDGTAPDGPAPVEPPPRKPTLNEVASGLDWGAAALMFLAVLGAGMAAIAIMSQVTAVLDHAGFSPTASSLLLGVTAGAAFSGSLCVGWLLDRWPPIVSSCSVAAAMTLGLLAFALLGRVPGLSLGFVGVACAGYAVGGGEVLWIALVKRRFGTAMFSWAYGGFYLALQAGYASGGFLAGFSLDHWATAGLLATVGAMYLPPALLSVAFSLRLGKATAPIDPPPRALRPASSAPGALDDLV